MAAENLSRKEKYLSQDYFRRNAFLSIRDMINQCPTHPSVLVDEVLHSIFFLGIIHKPQYSPGDILRDRGLWEEIESVYPRPFKLYRTQVPKRCPISCVLEMIVTKIEKQNGQPLTQETEKQIIMHLRNLTSRLRRDGAKDLTSSAICVSQSNDSARYFGVSMSTTGRNPGRIMVAASCLKTWDSYVADAVMTYNLNNRERRGSFDGTLQLQGLIRCEAFSLSQEESMPPCRSCGDLFGLETEVTRRWAYGNCAEAESISKLLAKERVEIQRKPEYTEDGKQRAKNGVKRDLEDLLRNVKISHLGFRLLLPS